MKAFVATIASLIATSGAQLVGYTNLGAYGVAAPVAAQVAAPVAAPLAYATAPAAIAPALPAIANSQYHAQDELNQYSFGHASGLNSRQESRNAYGVTTGSYSQVDANGIVQVTNYVADPIHGFRVASSNLPIAPEAPLVAPLEAPIFKAAPLEAPVMTLEQVPDTEEVAEAKAKFFEAYEAAKNREKRAIVPAATAPLAAAALPATTYGFPYASAYGAYSTAFPYAAYANAYATPALAAPALAAPAIAPAPVAATYSVAAPALATPAVATPAIAAPAVAAPVAAAYNVAAPAAGAIPSVKTTIKLNPGHATFYRIDPVA